MYKCFNIIFLLRHSVLCLLYSHLPHLLIGCCSSFTY
uniref:Uncharacterized protein n=1 Tax=Anguilla anguilla TaxID=7936 RepID=A0A0E9RF95_ANGAN